MYLQFQATISLFIANVGGRGEQRARDPGEAGDAGPRRGEEARRCHVGAAFFVLCVRVLFLFNICCFYVYVSRPR